MFFLDMFWPAVPEENFEVIFSMWFRLSPFFFIMGMSIRLDNLYVGLEVWIVSE